MADVLDSAEWPRKQILGVRATKLHEVRLEAPPLWFLVNLEVTAMQKVFISFSESFVLT